MIKDKEFAYGFLLKILAGGLYPDEMHVIREYIQNSYDSVREYTSITKQVPQPIKVLIKKNSIFIHDHGIGMDLQGLHEFRKIGFSRKKPEESVGFQGIGKLAGITVAKKLIVTTSQTGINKKYTLVFDAEGMLTELKNLKDQGINPTLSYLINKHTHISDSNEKKEEHYTFVELKDIRDNSSKLLDEGSLIDYISKHCPVPFSPEFKFGKKIDERLSMFVPNYGFVEIFVNSSQVFKRFIDNLYPPEFIDVKLPDTGERIGYCWYCMNKDSGQISPAELAGLVYRHKNFRVGDNYLTRKTLWKRDEHLAFWFIGEIHINNNYLIPSAERNNFQNTG